MKRFLFTIVLSVFTLNSYSAVSSSKERISGLVEKIRDQKRKIKKFEADLRSVEKKLESDNKKYLSTIKHKEELESEIRRKEREIRNGQKRITVLEEESRSVFALLILEEMGDEDISSLAAKKVVKDILNRQLNEIASVKKGQESLLKRWKNISRKVKEYTEIEYQLLSVLDELEAQKRKYVATYLAEKDQKAKLEMKFERQRIALSKSKIRKTKRVKLPPGMSFGLPLKSFSKFEIEKKGLSFFAKAGSNIVSPEAGKVIFSGNLSTYGKVIMVDHGKGWRSVILGPLSPKVKKGSKVGKNQELASIKDKSGFEKRIYFELRNKNEVVETMPLIKELVAGDVNSDQTANM